MEYIGFGISQEDYEQTADELLAEFDKAVTQPDKVVLQVVLTWDEFALLAPALQKAGKDGGKWGSHPAYSRYQTGAIELPAPEKDLEHGGVYKGVEIYVRSRPIPPYKAKTVAVQ